MNVLVVEDDAQFARLLMAMLAQDDTGAWQQIESYVRDRSNAEFSHGICPECAQRLYGK